MNEQEFSDENRFVTVGIRFSEAELKVIADRMRNRGFKKKATYIRKLIEQDLSETATAKHMPAELPGQIKKQISDLKKYIDRKVSELRPPEKSRVVPKKTKAL